MSVEFKDNSVSAKKALRDAAIAFLWSVANTLTSEAMSNSSAEEYRGVQAKRLWSYVVDEDKLEATVGSPYEAGFWEELGTGEYAINFEGGSSGKGRKGWWVYVEGNEKPSPNQKQYTEQEAKETAAYLRSKGLDAHATKGRKPNRPLFRAFSAKKNVIIKQAEREFGEAMK